MEEIVLDEMECFNNVLNFGQSFYQSCGLDISILAKFYQFVVVKLLSWIYFTQFSNNIHLLCVNFLKINLQNKNRPHQEPTRLDLYKSTNCANADRIKFIQLRWFLDTAFDSNGAGEI